MRERLGPLSGVALAVSSGPQHEQAWARGAEGEVKLARKLERWTAGRGIVLLHDRRMPRSRANIDHLAIGPSGVTVLGRLEVRGVPVLPPRQTAKLCRADGALNAAAVQALARDLARLLPAA